MHLAPVVVICYGFVLVDFTDIFTDIEGFHWLNVSAATLMDMDIYGYHLSSEATGDFWSTGGLSRKMTLYI